MCGIAGLLDPDWSGTEADLGALAGRMADGVAHRGPDDRGTWCDPSAGVALGHRRLSIVDLSPAGHQPMTSADGRWVITYNGECYNASDIRAELPGRGQHLRGHCDTEIVVEAVAAWGLTAALGRLDAMFATALWDRRDRVLHLVRDRVGEKPLYYSVTGRRVLFGSELRALRGHPSFAAELDRHAIALLLRLNYIPAPSTIYASTRKLAAGSMVSIPAGHSGWPEPVTWWDFAAIAGRAAGRRPPVDSDSVRQEAVERMESLLSDSVARRLVADVPVGTFLSGGIDSSLITALAQGASKGTVRTFTVGFGGAGEDETRHAAAVARHLGTDHVEMDLSPADALAAVPDLHRYWDEPFADPSQLPTLLLCREARRHVTVALSGDGGDEVFGGYRRYTAGAAAARWLLPLPRPARRLGAQVLEKVPPAWWDAAGPALGARAHKMARLLESSSPREAYVSLVSSWDSVDQVTGDGRWAGPPDLGWPARPLDAMMAWDTLSTLPDEMLVKVDRASMAFALEVRPPLLDHRVVEAAWELAPQLRIDGRVGKQILRHVLDRHLPRELVERPKTGFDPPLATWLRGPLRPWAEDLLSPDRLRAQGLVRPEPVEARWRELLDGKGGREYALWSVLVLQSWLDGQAAPTEVSAVAP
jgi:asparagine synthase (glutamine-hydrolysing)